MTMVNLIVMGRMGAVRGLDRSLAFQPVQMVVQIVFGIGAALVWRQALKWIFGSDVRQVVRRGITPARGMWLLLPLLLYAIALPALNGLGALLFDATWRWLPYGFDLNYLIGICIVAAFLFTIRDVLRRLELSSVAIVLAFVLLAELAHHLIDREILRMARYLSKEQMPWEETLRLRLPTDFLAAAIYQTVLSAIGAAAAYGILRLIFGGDLVAIVRRVELRLGQPG